MAATNVHRPSSQEKEYTEERCAAQGTTSQALKTLEDVLEAYGCGVHGMSEFNLCCEELGLYEFYTSDYIAALAEYIHSRNPNGDAKIIEVGAGSGRLSFLLNREMKKRGAACRIIASDPILEPAPGQRAAVHYRDVEQLTYQEAIRKHRPSIVICAWMPMDQDWTKDFRSMCDGCVQEYILVGEADVGNCGHNYYTWGNAAYKGHPLQAPDGSTVASTGTRAGILDDSTFERANLDDVSRLQLQRYDAPHAWGNSSTVSFRRGGSRSQVSGKLEKEPPAPARSSAWDVLAIQTIPVTRSPRCARSRIFSRRCVEKYTARPHGTSYV